MALFRIKICGVTRPEDARVIAEAGADAIGLNFYSQSPRFVTDERAAEIVAALPSSVAKVGVFVNTDAATIRKQAERLALDWVQLHGDEPQELMDELQGLHVVRAMRLRDSRTVPPAIAGGRMRQPEAVLLDAYSAFEYGGTGTVVRWDLVPDVRRILPRVPLILAGGLTPENVAEAIRIAQPDAVDVASGVESSAGIKDREKVRTFVAAARSALPD